MSTLLVACRTLAGEVALALRETGCDHPVRWVEPGLDVRPDALRACLQSEIDGAAGAGRVLLAFGYCGHALLGLRAAAELVFPRADDCISLVLGSTERRQAIAEEAPTYFLTEGWLGHGSNLWDDYRRAVASMGPARARQAYSILLANYRRLGVIDTGACPLSGLTERTRPIAASLGLDHHVIAGSTRLLRQLLTGPWDGGFVTIRPGGTVTLEHLLGQDATR